MYFQDHEELKIVSLGKEEGREKEFQFLEVMVINELANEWVLHFSDFIILKF